MNTPEHSEPRWKRQPDERPGQILDAAVEVFAEKGFSSATMDEIASAAGITKGTIYLYFPSKEELFVTMARRQFERALALLPEVRLEEATDPEQITRRLGREFLRIFMTPEVAKVFPLIIAEYNHVPALQDLYRNEMLPRLNFQLAALLELGMEAGYIRRMDPVIASRCLMGMFFAFVMTQEVFGAKQVTPMEPDDIVDTVVSIYYHGVLNDRTAE
jgi:AcrR family transcriptional regulator